MAEPVLRIENLCKNFGGLRVTDDVTLDVMPGELHAVIGPNGAGKTTLINQISGLLAPEAGRIVFAGEDVTRLPVARARSTRACALVPDHLDPAALLGAGECRAGRAGAARHELPLLRQRGGRGRAECARARSAGAGRPRRARRRAGRRAVAWREARARACDRARHGAEAACCSTSRWPAPAATRPSGWSRCCAR